MFGYFKITSKRFLFINVFLDNYSHKFTKKKVNGVYIMGKEFEFFRDIIKGIVDDRALNYGVCKAVDILLDLKIDEEVIKQVLVKHFDMRYSEADNVLREAKDYRK